MLNNNQIDDSQKSKEQLISELNDLRKEAEKLKQKEKLYYNIIDSVSDGIVVYDSHFNELLSNSAFYKRLGYEKGELDHKQRQALIYPEDWHRIETELKALSIGNKLPMEYRIIHKDGSWRTQSAIFMMIPDEPNNSLLNFAIIRDITHQKELNSAFDLNADLLNNILESMSDGILVLDKNFCYTYWNLAMEELSNIPRAQLTTSSKKAWEHFPHLAREGVDKMMKMAMKGTTVQRDFIPYDLENGKSGFTSETFLPLRYPNGEIRGVLGIVKEVTEKKQANEQLLLMARFAQDNPAPVIRFDLEGRILMTNRAASKIFGLDDAIDYYISQFFPRFKDDNINIKHLIENGLIIETESEIEDQYFHFIIRGLPDLKVGHIYGSNITHRKGMEEQIKLSLKEKEVLLGEIYHRVKNNLQSISSIIRLQSHQTDNTELLDSFQVLENRIKSIAYIHEKLYQSENFSKVNFKEYLIYLTSELFSVYGIRKDKIQLKLDLEAIDLGIDKAIPCALIVNELISNSLKHGFPDDKTGIIEISFSESNDNTHELELLIRDNGVGIPDSFEIDQSKTLGLTLVKRLSGQLKSELEINRKPNLEYRIKFNRED